MDEDVADGALIDVRGIDLASLLTEPAESNVKTALDRLLISSPINSNGFESCIG